MTRVTLTDVARHCGVSRATASLVLNNSPLVAAPTAARVRAAMSELGYVYNRAAASLRTRRTNAIGVVLTQVTNPYFAEFAAGLQDTLSGSDAVALLAVSGEDRALQHRQLRSLVERSVDGIVLVPAQGSTAADLPDLLGTPLVLTLRRLPGADLDYVGPQNHAGGYAAAAHLYGHGCRRLAFVGGFTDSSARQERVDGVRAFLAGHELTLAAECSCEPLRPAARNAAARLLGACPVVDGIVCFSDVVAFGVLDALADRGRAAGADVRVIGFDDLLDAALNRPSLSSVAVPSRDAGRRAARLVLERAGGSAVPAVSEEFPAMLRPRETCGCPRPESPHPDLAACRGGSA